MDHPGCTVPPPPGGHEQQLGSVGGGEEGAPRPSRGPDPCMVGDEELRGQPLSGGLRGCWFVPPGPSAGREGPEARPLTGEGTEAPRGRVTPWSVGTGITPGCAEPTAAALGSETDTTVTRGRRVGQGAGPACTSMQALRDVLCGTSLSEPAASALTKVTRTSGLSIAVHHRHAPPCDASPTGQGQQGCPKAQWRPSPSTVV